MGRDRAFPIRKDWEEVKVAVMTAAVWAKFTQHEDLRSVLVGTGDALLVEFSKKDHFWGNGGDGSGRNMLGHVLMKVRSELRDAGSR